MLSIRKKLFKNRKGFTLIELIVVIAILAILAVLAVPRFLGTLEDARIKSDVATARTIVSAVTIGEAEGVYTSANYDGETEALDIAQLVTDGYLDAVPESAQTNGQDFVLSYTSSGIVITISGLTGNYYPYDSTN